MKIVVANFMGPIRRKGINTIFSWSNVIIEEVTGAAVGTT